MNESDPYDFDSQFTSKPRKTYGKSRLPRVQTAPTLVRATKSEITTAQTSPSPPASPVTQPRRRVVASSSKNKLQSHKYGRSANEKRVEETQSQPQLSTTAMEIDGDDKRKLKKPRLVRSQSEKAKIGDVYSTPDSSPSSPPPRVVNAFPRSVPVQKPQAKGRRTPERDTKTKTAVSSAMPFSAKTTRALDNLSLSSETPPGPNQTFALRLSKPQPGSSTSKPMGKKRPSPEADSSSPVKKTEGKGPKRRRLIDALNAQADSSSEDEEEEHTSSQETAVSPHRVSPGLHSSTPPPPEVTHQSKVVRQVHSAKKAGPKFTYSGQQRTMLAEEEDIFGHGLGSIDEEPSSKGPLLNFGRPKSTKFNAFDFMDEDDETVNTGAVRSVHELRQAGANSRFTHEMDDILDRIGVPTPKPSPLRRGALLELAEKIKEKDFQQQFRNHSNNVGVFKSLKEETDIVCGYSIVAIFATLLATSVSAHLLQQVLESGLAPLLGRLLGETTDIVLLVKDRRQNVSRNGQTTLGGIKASFLKLPIWEPMSPVHLSPRTLGLKCLDLILRQPSRSSVETEIYTAEVTDRLFAILSASTDDSWDFPSHQASIDFYLALYLTESHSINALQSRLGTRWTSHYIPIVADVVETALRRPADESNDLDGLALRVALNVTNHNEAACRQFVERGLLLRLVESACVAFELSLNSVKVDSFLPKVHESLIMMLGVMINFCVYYPPASESLGKSAKASKSPLERLIRVFADNHAKTADADSIQKTQLNVALGYLSILLGYLCLNQAILKRFASVHPKKSLQPLLDSINEFIHFHQRVANAEQDGELKQETDFAALGRLKGLVTQLEEKLQN
ncbi:wings apart-like protein 1 [Rhypophila decipiens]|uniref:Wings apart-like protein 1 n=1 Tax=Rhypophila decipiens TaxID=261697 RepID=A0AAN7BDJ3_9PEZI|nr:wings apart-like protein 1 [Rhypophila decipiens]